jgi:hypothetical protein
MKVLGRAEGESLECNTWFLATSERVRLTYARPQMEESLRFIWLGLSRGPDVPR